MEDKSRIIGSIATFSLGEPPKAKSGGQVTNCLDASLVSEVDTSLFPRVPRWKRALDLAILLIGLPALVPLMALIAIYVKLASPGPVFFRQKRIGYGGLPFECLKFRSMRVGADVSVHQQYLQELIRSDVPMTKMDNQGDHRLIPGAKLLRSSGLDELPQLINVLRGEMSIVGPRPCTPYEYSHYLPWHRLRCATLPGLTGLWQVSGKNKTTFNEMVNLDIYYAKHKTFWFDLKIMAMTFPALANQIKESRRNAGQSKAANGTPVASTALSNH